MSVGLNLNPGGLARWAAKPVGNDPVLEWGFGQTVADLSENQDAPPRCGS